MDTIISTMSSNQDTERAMRSMSEAQRQSVQSRVEATIQNWEAKQETRSLKLEAGLLCVQYFIFLPLSLWTLAEGYVSSLPKTVGFSFSPSCFAFVSSYHGLPSSSSIVCVGKSVVRRWVVDEGTKVRCSLNQSSSNR